MDTNPDSEYNELTDAIAAGKDAERLTDPFTISGIYTTTKQISLVSASGVGIAFRIARPVIQIRRLNQDDVSKIVSNASAQPPHNVKIQEDFNFELADLVGKRCFSISDHKTMIFIALQPGPGFAISLEDTNGGVVLQIGPDN
ncbi:MAG: hypothetical protein AAFQ71_11645 [Planctomycetota bacterium]